MKSTDPEYSEGCLPLGPGSWRFKPPEFPCRVREGLAPYVRTLIRDVINGQKPWPLYLFGEVDAGKTAAALCIGDHVGGWYLALPDLCGMIRQAMKGELFKGAYRWTEYEIWKDWETTSLCILDELGTRKVVTDHHYEVLKRALDLREGRPIVLICNLDPNGLRAVYDDRIHRRVCRGTNVELFKDRRPELTGPDRRIEESK